MNNLLSGKSEKHLTTYIAHYKIHEKVLTPFKNLVKAAAEQGFDLRVCSTFISYEDQLKIWNLKATGQKTLFDDYGQTLEFNTLSEKEIVFSIMRWSALPGVSRHHWGTDMDVYDFSKVPKDYVIRLIPQEVDSGGMFAPLHEWLDDNMNEFKFFRPFAKDNGGIAPERWHLSYKPIADQLEAQIDYQFVLSLIENSPNLALRKVVLDNLDEIYSRFIKL